MTPGGRARNDCARFYGATRLKTCSWAVTFCGKATFRLLVGGLLSMVHARAIDSPDGSGKHRLDRGRRLASVSLIAGRSPSQNTTRMLDIVFASFDYLPNIGGVATHVHELARACRTLGHNVHVLSMNHGPWNRVRTWQRPRQSHNGIPATYLSIAGLPGGHLIFWRLRRQLQDFLRQTTGDRPLIFHVHDAAYGHYLADYVGCDRRVFTNHTSGFLQDCEDAERRAEWRERFQRYDRVIAPSSELAEKTIAVGCPAERVSSIPNGVDPARFKPDPNLRALARARLQIPDDHVVILAARRFVPKNGVIDFAHALRWVDRHSSQVTIVFAGNGFNAALDPLGYEKECLAAIRATSVGRRARLLGAVDNREMHELYAAADISVLPSLKEATSLSGLEAMSAGLPLVGTRVGGIPEMIQHDTTGLLVEPGDPRGLAEAVERLVTDSELRRQLGANARQRVLREFSWSRIAAKTVGVYGVDARARGVVPMLEGSRSHGH